jgi:bisphosphoglycerate-independent phosphoglycerate mutase (AlkP superfamily)
MCMYAPAPRPTRIGSHLNIGAGRVVWQDIVKIDVSIKKKQFHKNETILACTKRAKDGNGRLHLLGLVSRISVALTTFASIPPYI